MSAARTDECPTLVEVDIGLLDLRVGYRVEPHLPEVVPTQPAVERTNEDVLRTFDEASTVSTKPVAVSTPCPARRCSCRAALVREAACRQSSRRSQDPPPVRRSRRPRSHETQRRRG